MGEAIPNGGGVSSSHRVSEVLKIDGACRVLASEVRAGIKIPRIPVSFSDNGLALIAPAGRYCLRPQRCGQWDAPKVGTLDFSSTRTYVATLVPGSRDGHQSTWYLDYYLSP
jgi:hypothetical protein